MFMQLQLQNETSNVPEVRAVPSLTGLLGQSTLITALKRRLYC